MDKYQNTNPNEWSQYILLMGTPLVAGRTNNVTVFCQIYIVLLQRTQKLHNLPLRTDESYGKSFLIRMLDNF